MRAAVIHNAGDVPTVEDRPEPEAGAGEELLLVAASGLNPVDLMLASGDMGDVVDPTVPGKEAVGTTADGRRVYSGTTVAPHGGYAERALVASDELIDVPDGISDEQAIVMGIAGLAAWLPLTEHARISGGERVLVLGASGIVGQVAVQGAKALGAAYVVAAGRDREALEGVGADAVAVLGDDPRTALAEAAGQEGFDVVLDAVFGDVLPAALAAAGTGTTVVVIGPAAGMEASIPFFALQGNTIVGHGNDVMPIDVRRRAYASLAEQVLAGAVRVGTEAYALDDVAAAWKAQAAGTHAKLVLVP